MLGHVIYFESDSMKCFLNFYDTGNRSYILTSGEIQL